ncbi:MFS transporter [Arthrobacter sp. UYCu712]|uniref:MFS transporter n=1 Tax=Arthrobacter sp. UYCu712 TaxID=3156340 RepID=UPI003396AE1C
MIGTTIEWYDFFTYANAAGLVFAKLFFEPAGSDIGILISFASIGLSFVFRPLGAFLAGHFGDRLGRRAMLVLTLVLMGVATTLIGVLPTYETAGIIAPVLLLLLLRILQGISAGGEWGGAVLMAVSMLPRASAAPRLVPAAGRPTGHDPCLRRAGPDVRRDLARCGLC